MKPQDLLRKAADTIDERAAQRGLKDERSMARTVEAFNALVGGDKRLTEQEGWLFMCCLKMARGIAGDPRLDDAIDLAGYAALWGESLTDDKTEEPEESEWIEYKPGAYAPTGFVQARRRDGVTIGPKHAAHFSWEIGNAPYDIVAYRYVKPGVSR